jgi:hypothetical protein
MLVKTGKGKLPDFKVAIKGQKDELKGKITKDGHLEYQVKGDAEIHINWNK